jgi:transposase InsO family protein
VKFAFIAAEQAFPIALMCRLLEVSRSGFYAWRDRPESKRVKRDRELSALVEAEFKSHHRGCGARPIVAELREQGQAASRRRVGRLLREAGLRHTLNRRSTRTTYADRSHRFAKNLLRRRFEVGVPNRVWASDITYLPTKNGFCYLAVVIDVGSRRVVGWRVGATMEQELVLGALRDAIRDRQPPPGVIHHSDRGVQYTSEAHRALLAEHQMICSMSRKGNCWDNAVVESFFSSLKRELPNNLPFEDRGAADRAAFAYIAAYYNTRRRHSALGYVAPNKYENQVNTRVPV